MAIPKLIHQTIASKDELIPAFSTNIETLRSRNKGWKHTLYEDADIRHYLRNSWDDETLQLWEMINPNYGAARADFFRYHLIYDHGGVYLDIKSTVTKKLDDVLKPTDSYLLSRWGKRYPTWGYWPEYGVVAEYQQWHIIAERRHPFLAKVIETVRHNIQNYHLLRLHPKQAATGKDGVLRITGPIAYTQAIEPMLADHPHRIVDIEALGFCYSILETPTDRFAHERAFANHYLNGQEPIITATSDKNLTSQ